MKGKLSHYFFAFMLFLLISERAVNQFLYIYGIGIWLCAVGVVSVIYMTSHSSLFKRASDSFPMYAWGCLMLYHLINSVIKGTQNIFFDMHFHITAIEQACTLMICTYLYVQRKNLLYVSSLTALYFYLFTSYIFAEYVGEDERLTGFLYSTQVGQMASLTCVICAMYINKFQKGGVYFLLFIFPIHMILLSQTRNALVPLLFSFLILLLPALKKIKVMTLILWLVIGVIVYYYLRQSVLWERIVNREVGALWETNTILDDIFGDRAMYYFLGFRNFADNPITGIGLYNFMDYNNFEFPIHGEFISHIAEGGIIGACLYLVFIGYYIKFLLQGYHFSDTERNVMILAFLSLIILGFTTREYPFTFMFVIFGLISGYIKEQQLLNLHQHV